MWTELDLRLLRFVRGTRCSLLDLVIDTTSVDGRFQPCLALWAYDAHDPVTFDDVARSALERGELEDFFDVVHEVKSDTPGVLLGEAFPKWPDELDTSELALADHVTELASRHPSEFEGVERIWLRFMGAEELKTLRGSDRL